jgi:16S rRNA (cytidine1402-2'-O)-methyltransferase
MSEVSSNPPNSINSTNSTNSANSLNSPKGVLYLVATPIGTLGDFSMRAQEVLKKVDVVACEDTRHSGQLLQHFGIQKKLLSLHEHNENERTNQVLSLLGNGESVALVSDAGTPAISDPGAQLVNAVHSEGYAVLSVPGPSSLSAALAAGGFLAPRKLFVGFFPRNSKDQRDEILVWQKVTPCVVVFFESPRRLLATLKVLQNELPSLARVCVSREISKRYEEHIRGSANGIHEVLAKRDQVVGECVVQIELPKTQSEVTLEESVAAAQKLLEGGLSIKESSKKSAVEFGFRSKDIYAALVAQNRNLGSDDTE